MFFYRIGTDLVILLIYVDEIIITESLILLINQVLTKLQHEFLMKDVQPLRYFLGIQVDQTNYGLFINQQKYIQDFLHKISFHTANGC